MAKYYETELAQFADEFFSSKFIPFPSVDDTVDAIIETSGSIIDGDNYVLDVLAELKRRIEVENDTT